VEQTPLEQHPPIDYQLLLLSLAEDYFEAAHGGGALVALVMRNELLNRYHRLIATGLGCLEAVLKVHPMPWRSVS
jgi:hypothetical protein